jgi:hypothetical protein
MPPDKKVEAMPKKEDVETTKDRLLREAMKERRDHDARARAHQYDERGHHVLLGETGSGLTPGNTPYGTPWGTPQKPKQESLPRGSYEGRQLGYGRPAFGTPSTRNVGKTPAEIAWDERIRQQAIREQARRERVNAKIRNELTLLEEVGESLRQQLRDNQGEEDRKFFAGTGFGEDALHKNTDKTYIKF